MVGSPAAGAEEFGNQPGRFFDVTKFGAKGDGRTIDTAAINRAIDAAATRGGTVYFPAGTYASYSIHLKSNIALYLGANATILAAAPAGGRGYDPAEPGAGNPYQDFGHSHWHNSLIWGENLENVTIEGPGKIDGKGLVAGGSAESAPLNGNKAIALKLCRNVAIRDITIVNGGHFGILPTGVDNFRIEGLVIDTNRDGINIDCCKNVRIADTTVNSPNDDAIVLKSSYALNQVRDTENVTIDNCFVSGYDLGTLVGGTFKTSSYGRTGRVKFGTESNGGFRNIAISNVVFEHCRGLALETVDGGRLEDVTISNLTMRNVQMPLFLRLGARMRGPAGIPVGFLRRVSISDVTTIDADPRYPSCLAGIPGHPIEDVKLSNIRHHLAGGLTPGDAVQNPPELETAYPEPSMFGTLPAYGFFVRHARGISWDNVDVRFGRQDTRPAYVLRDVADADVHHCRAEKVAGTPTFVLDGVDDFRVSDGRPVPEARVDHADHQEL
ncbi:MULTISPECIES: glycoside hydrolase family 28 protein [unclassified Amycolatopsis]|uniref:rhamnogalacturonidase n=1 Tax=unclassified Amycolatopsis TaxID=2618356 RepID=UPI0028742958|nr:MULTISPECIES: glycoside hydrolase family 28 protein [unclassified Amycolatopsis]MDS0138951.1 glycoside hydrolase family 28 protein [Amycolatopsis sp. 505]MDS0147623.1 glycoside hydrolase family 28 protein [Amycolatopsis sp. CM201R]